MGIYIGISISQWKNFRLHSGHPGNPVLIVVDWPMKLMDLMSWWWRHSPNGKSTKNWRFRSDFFGMIWGIFLRAMMETNPSKISRWCCEKGESSKNRWVYIAVSSCRWKDPMAWRFIWKKKNIEESWRCSVAMFFFCGLLFGGDWNMNGLWLSIYGNNTVTPTDFIFFRGVETTNQIVVVCYEKLIKHMWINCVVFWVQDRGGSEMGVENKRLKKAKGTYFSEGFQSVLEIISLEKACCIKCSNPRPELRHQTLCKRCGSTPRIPPYSHWNLSWFFGQQETTNYYEQMTMCIYIYIRRNSQAAASRWRCLAPQRRWHSLEVETTGARSNPQCLPHRNPLILWRFHEVSITGGVPQNGWLISWKIL